QLAAKYSESTTTKFLTRRLTCNINPGRTGCGLASTGGMTADWLRAPSPAPGAIARMGHWEAIRSWTPQSSHRISNSRLVCTAGASTQLLPLRSVPTVSVRHLNTDQILLR